jgi:hypothetical protein
MRRLGQIAIFDQRRGGVIALEQRQQMEDRARLAVRQNRRRGEIASGLQANISSISPDISKLSFSNLPILNRTRLSVTAWVRDRPLVSSRRRRE